ncbi:docking protein 2 [Planococcus citri]|uniref:docking protein 2 n=1 Tax=Planococcus citri TaxID=170843 RepID=UPI0031F9329A
MSEIETPLKQGFLGFPPQGVLSQLKKSWQKKYCQLFKSSKHGVDRLEVFDSEEEVGKTSSNVIITLENCVKITQDPQKNHSFVFAVITKSNSYYFSANSEVEMKEWISAFQNVAFKDNVSRQTIEEDNDLYCSSGNAGVFNVKLIHSDASNRCGLITGYYTLLATPVALQLLQSDDQRTLFTWPYRYIRRYGYRSSRFSFEAGRKCESGEGTFHFEGSKDIFKCISTKMKSMKELLNHETHNFPFGDHQIQAAMSMVARSRSPLPPSPTSATSPLIDSEICGFSQMKPFYHNTSSATSFLTNSLHEITPPPLKPKMNPIDPPSCKLPEIPPRRTPVSEMIEKDASEVHEPHSSHSQTTYDSVEVRNEAWRTMGVDVANHNDLFKATPAQAVPPRTNSPKFEKSDNQQRIFHVSTNNSGNYDRLQHIGPILKHNTAPGYKQIPVITSSLSNVRIDEPIFACRRADDFKGYGMIRKKSAVEASNEDVSKQFLTDDISFVMCRAEKV